MTGAARAVRRFDASVDRAFDHLRGRPPLDRLMYAASELGDFSLIWHTIAVAEALLGDSTAERRAVRTTVGLGIESAVVNGLVKSLFRRERPEPPAEGRPHRLREPRTSSFPSGHASAAACALVLMGERDRPWRTAAYAFVGAVVATSRIHVRIHHGSDVVGGAATGIVIGSVIRHLWPLR